MKKYFIIITIALIALVLIQFFRCSEPSPIPEIHEKTEVSSSKGARNTIKAPVVEAKMADQSPKEGLKQSSVQTLWEQGNYPERLQIADLDMPLVFEGAISEELKQVVLADIHMIYNEGVTYSKYDWSGRPDNPAFNLSGRNYVSSETINLKASQVPNIVHRNLSRIIQVNGVDNVVVPEELISAYRKAWEARKAAPEKYESLEPFIDWLNTAPMEELKAKNPFWLFGYDGISDAYPEKAAELRNGLLPKTREDLRVSHPSILEFTYLDREALETEGATEQLPVGVTLADGKYVDENEVPYQQALFLYDGEEWHIAFAPAGT